MKKEQIDNYFTTNFDKITRLVNCHRQKSHTINDYDITTDLYLIAVERSEEIENTTALYNFLCVTASNIYRWNNSEYNLQNKVVGNNTDISHIISEDNTDEEITYQNRHYALRKYYAEAKPSERIFYNAYINEGVRSIRKVRDKFGISFRMASVVIKEFKQKIQDHERKIEEGKQGASSTRSTEEGSTEKSTN